jgi:ABC-type nitrate/sulfonate/bicarbonate transport system permease component
MLGKRLAALDSWLGPVVFLSAWQMLSLLGLLDPRLLPSPVEVLVGTATHLTLSQFLADVEASLFRVVSGFLIASLAGVFLGITSGWYRTLGDFVRAPIDMLRPIPPLAWIPAALIWFGLGEPSKIFVICLGAFFPAFTNTYAGMRKIDPDLLSAARMMGLSGWRILYKVAIPATEPDILTGLRISWSLSFGVLVAAELIASQNGLGNLIIRGREIGQIDLVIFGILAIGTITLFTDFLLARVFQRYRLRWYISATTESLQATGKN